MSLSCVAYCLPCHISTRSCPQYSISSERAAVGCSYVSAHECQQRASAGAVVASHRKAIARPIGGPIERLTDRVMFRWCGCEERCALDIYYQRFLGRSSACCCVILCSPLRPLNDSLSDTQND